MISRLSSSIRHCSQLPFAPMLSRTISGMPNMPDLRKFYINGEWVDSLSKQEFVVKNPANEEPVGSIMMASEADVNRAVAAAKGAFEVYAELPKEERVVLLEKLLSIYKDRYEKMAQAISLEMGAPIDFSRDYQADTGSGHLESFITALKAQEQREKLENGDTLVREPIGVCGLITPWNWPINQIALKVVPALATGCTCILKPSEYTPLSAALYAQMIHDAGFPPGVFNMINGEGEVAGSAMSKHQDIQMMSFTGSTRAGVAISKESADTVKRVSLELGGKSANILFADCDLETHAAAAVANCFSNSGQSCDAPTRLLVERSCYDKVLEIVKQTAEAQKVDDPAKPGDHIGPVFSDIHYGRVQEMIRVGIEEDKARVLVGGLGKPNGMQKGHWVRPTVFADVDNQMRIAREEIFGPVLVLLPFETEAEAISIANDSPYGLAAYLSTSDMQRAERVARKLRAGQVHVNDAMPEYGTPFGGYKQSGNGREGGLLGLEDFQEVKALCFPK
eukprot:TRINITY_DN12449_c0_g1_i1.p1 TRINITY_DN12449_c0_g1~~TRINITY_DN12449_c0_g1_i1.p1  ORF type:complete len:507 (-),score=113.61 TRINITY_DN12449_c0_g1_i1:263-1783(-)